MTSQIFSNKLSSKFDFKQSFKSYIIPAVYLLYIMVYNIFNVLTNIIDEAVGNEGKTISFFGNLISKGYVKCYFNNDDFGELLILSLCFSGFLFALGAFVTFMRKQNCNFYFASPISRKDIFKNRIISGVIAISVVLFVPILVITIINLYVTSSPAFVIQIGLAYYFECLIYALSSFAIFSLAFAMSYTIVEGMIFGVGLFMLPSGLCLAFDLFFGSFLNTYTRQPFMGEFIWDGYNKAFTNISLLREFSLFNPLTLGTDLSNHELYINIITQSKVVGNEKMVLPSIYQIIPLIVWAVLIVAFIILAKIAFNKRKVENTAIHASNKFTNGFMATEFGIGASALTASAFVDKNKALVVFLALVAFVIGFVIFYSVSIRKIKHSKKVFAFVGTSVAVLLVFFTCLSTGGFGYDSYVPNAQDVEMVTLTGPVSADGSSSMSQDVLPVGLFSDNGIGIFTDENDIKKVTDLAKTFNIKSDNMVRSNVSVVYQLKNGKRVYRKYPKMSSDVKKSLLSLTDTKEYKDTQKYILTGKNPTDFDQNLIKYELDGDRYFNLSLEPEGDYMFESEDFRNYSANYAHLLIGMSSAVVGTIGSEPIKIDNTNELLTAIAEDYYNASYEEIYLTKEKAVCYVGFLEYEGSYLSDNYYIYPSMKNTLKYLDSIGVLGKLNEMNSVQSIEGAYVAKYGSEILNPYDLNINEEVFSGGIFVFDPYEETEYFEESVSGIYKNAKFVTDKAEIQKIIENSTPMKYVTAEDTIVLLKVKRDSPSNEYKYIPLVMLNN